MKPAEIPISRPDLGQEELQALAPVIQRQWPGMGAEVRDVEAAFSQRFAAPFVAAVSSGTAALDLALEAAGVGPGDHVITVSYSFIATANTIVHRGAVPVFVDIEPDGVNMDPARVEEAVRPDTRAILCVHQFGFPCKRDELGAIARRHGLALIEDAACALGSGYDSGGGFVPIGGPFAGPCCFSFHPRKVITCGEGGLVVSATEEQHQKIQSLRNHGLDVHGRPGSYESCGYNFRMSDLQAAVLKVQLSRLDGLIARRRHLAARYLELLPGLLPDARLPCPDPGTVCNWQSFQILLPERGARDFLLDRMAEGGVSCRPGIACAHLQPSFAALGPRRLPNSELAQDCGLLLPLYPSLTDPEQDRVLELLDSAWRSHG